MIEAFERHLSNNSFIRRAEQCKTLENKIEFCRKFLLENNAIPKPNPVFENLQAWQNMEVRALQSQHVVIRHRRILPMMEIASSHFAHAKSMVEEQLAHDIMLDCLRMNAIKFHQCKNMMNDTYEIFGEMRVIKP